MNSWIVYTNTQRTKSTSGRGKRRKKNSPTEKTFKCCSLCAHLVALISEIFMSTETEWVREKWICFWKDPSKRVWSHARFMFGLFQNYYIIYVLCRTWHVFNLIRKPYAHSSVEYHNRQTYTHFKISNKHFVTLFIYVFIRVRLKQKHTFLTETLKEHLLNENLVFIRGGGSFYWVKHGNVMLNCVLFHTQHSNVLQIGKSREQKHIQIGTDDQLTV